MITYSNRRASEYLKTLRQALSIPSLKRNATQLSPDKYLITKENTYERRCDIAFMGIAVNTLFDRGHKYLRGDVLDKEMEAIFASHNDFKKAGIWLRLRLLFLYPYSTYALSIINAETNVLRCGMDGDSVHPAKQEYMHVTESKFHSSSVDDSQRAALNLIQSWVKNYNWKSERGNSVAVRFTPISPNLCGLIVNNKAFCDSYILAKENRNKRQLMFSSPLVQIEKKKDDLAFRSLENHMDYLWQLNITLDCDDATRYASGDPDSLGSVHPPNLVTFNHKADRLVKHGHITEARRKHWMFMTKKQFERYVDFPTPDFSEEKIFISCSWKLDRNGIMRANEIALNLRNWIEEDITKSVSKLRPVIVEGQYGEDLSKLIYHELDTSKLGVVLLTDDIQANSKSGETRRLSKQNVYHELGYLMSSLNRHDRNNVFIALEDGVESGTNVGVKIHGQILSSEKLRKKKGVDVTYTQACDLYIDLLGWLKNNSELLETQVLKDAISHHSERIIKVRSRADKNRMNAKIEDLAKKLKETYRRGVV